MGGDDLVRPGDLGGPVVNGMELRDATGGSIEIKDVDEGRHQVLALFPHDRLDTYATTFGNRAFEDSFQQRPPAMCWQHDVREPIGHTVSTQITGDGNELRGQFGTFDAVPLARRAFAQLRDGTITDFSFGFRDARTRKTPNRPNTRARQIYKARMVEWSPVTIGSIPGAVMAELREEGPVTAQMEWEQLVYLRDNHLIDDAAFLRIAQEQFPGIALGGGAIILNGGQRDTGSTDGSVTPGSGAPDPASANEDVTAPVEWTAAKTGTSTATGPNDEVMMVRPASDEMRAADAPHHYFVMDSNGKRLGDGVAPSRDEAKRAAVAVVLTPRRSIEDYLTPEGIVNATSVRRLVADACPDMAYALRSAELHITPAGEGPPSTDEPASDIVRTLATQLDAALDSAQTWLQRADMGSLPEDVQQALALVSAAGTQADALMDALGIEDPDGATTTRADSKFSTKPWGDINESDYSDEQWKSACLIHGSGDTAKEACKLPVKEPDGTYNKNGIHAAAARLNQTEAPDEEKRSAAKKLMSLYHEMDEQVPPNVLKYAGGGKRSVDDAMALLDRRLAASKS